MTMPMGLPAAHVSSAAAALVSLLTVVGTVWFGRRTAGYSHLRDTISELGAAGTRDARSVAWLWFAPSGLLFALASVALGQAFGTDDAARAASTLGLVGAGWIGAAIFPCDQGAPTFGTVRNHLHNLTGGGAYLAGAAGLIEMGRALEDSHAILAMAAQASGSAVLVGLLLVSVPELPWRGLIQRVMEGLLHAWLLAAALTQIRP